MTREAEQDWQKVYSFVRDFAIRFEHQYGDLLNLRGLCDKLCQPERFRELWYALDAERQERLLREAEIGVEGVLLQGDNSDEVRELQDYAERIAQYDITQRDNETKRTAEQIVARYKDELDLLNQMEKRI